MPGQYFCFQDIKIYFDDVNFYAEMSLILDTPSRNSKTQQTIMNHMEIDRVEMNHSGMSFSKVGRPLI